MGRLRQYKDLCGKEDDDANNHDDVLDSIRKLEDCIETECGPRDPKYHIIRTKLGSSHITTKPNLKEIFVRDNCNYCFYH